LRRDGIFLSDEVLSVYQLEQCAFSPFQLQAAHPIWQMLPALH
jgi:hypothetical protein